MASFLPVREDIFTPEDFVDIDDVEIGTLVLTTATQTAHDFTHEIDFSDIDSTGSRDESSLEFSDPEDSEDEGEEFIVAERQSPTSHLAPRSLSPKSISAHSISDDSCSEAYDTYNSAHGELDEEPTVLETSYHVLDVERQRHYAAITDLEDRHASDMIEHAIEVQELRKTQDALREEGLVKAARETMLLGEREELLSQLDSRSSSNAALSEENKRLSLQVLEAQTRIVDLERDHIEMLASQEYLSTQLLNRTRELEKVKGKFAEEIHSITTSRDDASAEAARIRHELDSLTVTTTQEHTDLIDTCNALRDQLDSTVHELDAERMRARGVAVRSAEEIYALTESRDGLRAEVDRICCERTELSNTSQAIINSLRIELQDKTHELQEEHTKAISAMDIVSEEIRALHHIRDTTQSKCQSLRETISSLQAVVHDKEEQLTTTKRDLETCRKLALRAIDNLKKERNSLKEQLENVADALHKAQKADSQLKTHLSERKAL
ncbi:hypothetical protein J3R30DRAFT_1574092 [Lentinula aciculospora]|uniref:Uncharacterized protein n=1 Tax=Lentinula aciculospora TaxID=153920 RepID=A0A9W9DGB0_9AGAR|nr:hypothetical protein J3R30DRAFT_1574092 [Lentinula aciculospora]